MNEVVWKTSIFHSVFPPLLCCLNMNIIGLLLGWNICMYSVFCRRCCCIHQGLHVCVKCICRTCKVLQAVNEDDKIYYVTSPPMTGHKPRDFVILVSQRWPFKARWVCSFQFNCEHFGVSVLITVDLYLGLLLSSKDFIFLRNQICFATWRCNEVNSEHQKFVV